MPDFCGTKSKPPSSTPSARQHCNVRTCYHDGTVAVAPYRANLGAIGTILCGVARKAQCLKGEHQVGPTKRRLTSQVLCGIAHSLYPNPYGVWPNRQAVRVGPQDALCDDRAISEWPRASGDHLRSALLTFGTVASPQQWISGNQLVGVGWHIASPARAIFRSSGRRRAKGEVSSLRPPMYNISGLSLLMTKSAA